VNGRSRPIDVESLLRRYAVLLVDAYGVLVHSGGALPGAARLVDTLNAAGKPYYVLTNDASKLPTTAAARYQRYGLAIDAERIITSGLLLKGHFAAHHLVGARCVVLGTEDSNRYVVQAGGRIVPPSQEFDVLVVADEFGFPFLETVDAALSGLFRMLDRPRPVHLVLPNPDLIYPSGEGFGIAAGSVALVFESALRLRYPDRTDLRFARLGKPHAAMFAEALRRSGTRNMVMIGDQLEADIGGAHEFGLDSVLVGTGVSITSSADGHAGLQPTYLLPSLV
jgi:HAD superfamily hydrolase (TIGR01450 family)